MLERVTTEETRLIPETKAQEAAPTDKKKVILYVVEGTLIVVGLGAGALYWGPANSCITRETCGKWVADFISKPAALGVFLSGGVMFGCINAYFSGKSIPAFVEYIQNQSSLAAKISKSFLIITYAATQDLQLLLSAIATSTNALSTTITVLGGAPSALYSGTKLMEERFPYLISQLSLFMKKTNYYFSNLWSPLNEMDKQARNRLYFYEKQHATLLASLRSKWRYVVANARTLNFPEHADPLLFLATQPLFELPPSRLANAAHNSGLVAGFIIAVLLSYPFQVNTFHLTTKMVPNIPLALLIAAYLGSGSLYSNFDVTMTSVNKFFDACIFQARGLPSPSITYQLRPLQTMLVLATVLAFCVFSYAVEDTIFTNELAFLAVIFSVKAFHIARLFSDFSMNAYHTGGGMLFYHLMFSNLARDPRERFIFDIEKALEKVEKLSLPDYIELVEHGDAAKREALNIHAYDPEEDIEQGILQVEADTDSCTRWCRLFGKRPRARLTINNDENIELTTRRAETRSA